MPAVLAPRAVLFDLAGPLIDIPAAEDGPRVRHDLARFLRDRNVLHRDADPRPFERALVALGVTAEQACSWCVR